MKFEDLKVGKNIVHQSGGEYEVRATSPEDRSVWVFSPRTKGMYVIEEPLLTYYSNVPSAFRVGKTYKRKDGINKSTVTVLDIYEVDTPETEDDRVTVIARVDRPSGTQWITVLTEGDFKRYEEVK